MAAQRSFVKGEPEAERAEELREDSRDRERAGDGGGHARRTGGPRRFLPADIRGTGPGRCQA